MLRRVKKGYNFAFSNEKLLLWIKTIELLDVIYTDRFINEHNNRISK